MGVSGGVITSRVPAPLRSYNSKSDNSQMPVILTCEIELALLWQGTLMQRACGAHMSSRACGAHMKLNQLFLCTS